MIPKEKGSHPLEAQMQKKLPKVKVYWWWQIYQHYEISMALRIDASIRIAESNSLPFRLTFLVLVLSPVLPSTVAQCSCSRGSILIKGIPQIKCQTDWSFDSEWNTSKDIMSDPMHWIFEKELLLASCRSEGRDESFLPIDGEASSDKGSKKTPQTILTLIKPEFKYQILWIPPAFHPFPMSFISQV